VDERDDQSKRDITSAFEPADCSLVGRAGQVGSDVHGGVVGLRRVSVNALPSSGQQLVG
jgi:hypothetical protein